MKIQWIWKQPIWIMFEFEDNLSTGFHDVFLSKYSVSRIIHDSHTKLFFCLQNVYFRYDTITKQKKIAPIKQTENNTYTTNVFSCWIYNCKYLPNRRPKFKFMEFMPSFFFTFWLHFILLCNLCYRRFHSCNMKEQKKTKT